ncbi:TetR/AcrR family transcriptional regulator [Elioraea sp.]|uniref:TetR/AcrR family transcriptional regulator n=1 Tax=Elioraea sp. TaxID=2185103 RepID=UPI0025B81F07|nr:TetR/AcrR family transcriptional regulator [Elioraea sp.]
MARPDRDLREACIAEAMAIVAGDGVERLSLREVARRLGVSHQAPYKHFPSRDHILAAIVARAFAAFARFLDRNPRSDDADADLGGMGLAYLDYARAHPLEYRLMFGTPLPDGRAHPEMMAEARHAFALLCDGLRRRAAARGEQPDDKAIVLDALFIWSCLHGLAGIHGASLVDTLALPPGALEASPAHVLGRIGDALGH